MKEETVKKHAKYYSYIVKLGEMPLYKKATIKSLGVKSGAIKSAYNEMRKENFEGSFIEYLCWVSSLYILNLADSKEGMPLNDFLDFIILNKIFMPEVNNMMRLIQTKPHFFVNHPDFKKMFKELAHAHFKYISLITFNGELVVKSND